MPRAVWALRAATSTDTLDHDHLHATKAGNLIPGRAVTASAAAWLPTRTMTRAKSLSSRQSKDTAQRMTPTVPFEKLRNTKSLTKADHIKVRCRYLCLYDHGVSARFPNTGVICRARRGSLHRESRAGWLSPFPWEAVHDDTPYGNMASTCTLYILFFSLSMPARATRDTSHMIKRPRCQHTSTDILQP